MDQIALMRRYVGHERIVAVGASSAVRRDDGRFLMIQRADDGAWTFPAGYSDIGENAAQTAVRETFEKRATRCSRSASWLSTLRPNTIIPSPTGTR
ncbi:MAG: NUDIX domain-containing protein [Chloroflexi bacterium]|nr:NUDIX domain-containing protein [Chloroflexota bacterium]